MREELLAILKDIRPDLDFEKQTKMIDDGILDDGAMDCPNCGKKLEFDLDFDDDEADD